MNLDGQNNSTPSKNPAAGIRYELFLRCVHCGLCTSSCPTYTELGNENDGPRGRIQLMRMVADGRAGLTDRMRRHLELCLDCRSCETACPSGVQYGRLIEPFRLADEQSDHRTEKKYDWFREIILFQLFPYADRMNLLLWPVRWMQRVGLFGLAERMGLLKLIPGRMGRMIPLLPPPVAPGPKLPKFLPAVGRKRARVAFFVGCVADAMFRPVHWATLRVLQQNGCDVFIPPGQGCCGAIHYHAGDSLEARRMADANLVAFELDRYDAIVVNHGGCGAMMKEYGLHWRDGLQPHREKFAAKVKDINEFLDELGLIAPQGRIEATATYHDACHLGHAQGITAAPRRLLAAIPGLELRDLPESNICCGSAGTYNLREAEMSDRLSQRKIENILSTGAQIVLASNAGCLLQIQREVRQRKLPLRVMHPMELLDLSYRGLRPE
ncbi:MAG: (Fe-S)-binding protein [Planctomycetaceae bacterium]|nr:(Fe-S)-binding protein [Planctomycetaceae bacterium]